MAELIESKTKRTRKVKNSFAQAVWAERTSRLNECSKWLIITPSKTKSLIEAFRNGDYPNCVADLREIFENDFRIKTCIEKRTAMTCQSRWDIVIEEGTDKSLASAQAEVLRDFFNSITIRTTEALDAKGSVSDLVRGIMQAVVYGYSPIAFDFYPSRTFGGNITFHGVGTISNLKTFEAKARRLRVVNSQTGMSDALAEDWVVSHFTRPLAPSLLVLHFLKSIPEVDWSSVCEKFGTPFVVLQTTAKKGSEDWNDATTLAGNIGSAYSAVIGTDLQMNIEKLAQGGAPHRELVEYMDRAISSLVLGGDLETMSRENAVGSDAQNKTQDYLVQSDRAFVENVIDKEIVQPLLRKIFGNKPQCAHFSLSSSARDLNALRQQIEIAKTAGVPLSKSWVYESLGIPAPTIAEDIINEQPKKKTPLFKIAKAQVNQFAPLLEKLKTIATAESDEKARILAEQLLTEFPELKEKILNDDQMGETLAKYVKESVQEPEI